MRRDLRHSSFRQLPRKLPIQLGKVRCDDVNPRPSWYPVDSAICTADWKRNGITTGFARLMVSPFCRPLHEILFPDIVYRAERCQQHDLVLKLREIADEIDTRLEKAQNSDFCGTSHDGQPSVSDTDLQARNSSCHEAGPSGVELLVEPTEKKRKEKREFNIGAYQRRYVALEVFYSGWKYHGFASQADTQETVEGHLFLAMRKTRLIPDNVGWEGLGYSRCGRTDKGVSALGQVIALWLRSGAKAGEAALSADEEMDYAVALNRALPDDIRVLGWTPVPQTFSARFSAVHREYKYFIVQRGDLNLAAMREAAGHFVGDHDFRNFCKVDAQHVSSFRRTILDFRIKPLEGLTAGGSQVYALHIRGTAFLWHQVRCMAAVLLLVGRGLESPDVVRRLLDVEDTPSKPQYNMAPEEPLLFYACVFDSLHFKRSAQSHAATRAAVQSQLDRHLICTALLHTVSEHLAAQAECEVAGSSQPKPPKHIPLLKRATEPPVEERLTKYGRQIKSRDVAATLATANS